MPTSCSKPRRSSCSTWTGCPPAWRRRTSRSASTLASEGERRLRALLEALLTDAPLDEAAQATAKQIDLPLDTVYQAFALWLQTDNPLDSSRAAASIRDQGILALTEADRIVGLVPAGHEDRLRVSSAVLRITAQPVAKGNALRVALTEIRMADDLARRLQLRGELSLRDLTLERLLAHRRGVGDELCRGTLDVLDDDEQQTLLRTLQEYIAADTDRQTTAKALHIHPNTVDYGLRRAERLTGLNLRTTRDSRRSCSRSAITICGAAITIRGTCPTDSTPGTRTDLASVSCLSWGPRNSCDRWDAGCRTGHRAQQPDPMRRVAAKR